MVDSKVIQFQGVGITLKTCKIELAHQVSKQTGQIELAFETGLMFCFGYSLGDVELQDSFRESLTLRLVLEVHSLFFLAS